jgi:hypothetical protein
MLQVCKPYFKLNIQENISEVIQSKSSTLKMYTPEGGDVYIPPPCHRGEMVFKAL